jgi:enoyl-CoA hydratase/carnithine racemase
MMPWQTGRHPMETGLHEKRGRIAYITLNRPEALNALDDDLNRERWSVWRDFADDETSDVAILTGADRTLDDALRIETLNAYSCLDDFRDDGERLAPFYKSGSRGRGSKDS